jgi:geranylgeranyl reductase
VAGIVFTHKVAGPIFKMKRLLRQVGAGKLVLRERLRKGDELQHFFEVFEEMVAELRKTVGLEGARTLRHEGAPIPMKPAKRWDNGRDVVLAGDAAGVVAPASGEGIYYAMVGGELAAQAAEAFLATGDARALGLARKRFMKLHGRVFWILGIMQYFWYSSEKRREKFVSICQDKDVQRLTWESYMEKKLTRRDPMAHVRIFFKDLAHLFGLARA